MHPTPSPSTLAALIDPVQKAPLEPRSKNGTVVGAKSCVTSILHWHAHAFRALQFTDDGAYLLSGGQVCPFIAVVAVTPTRRQERVLVQWQMHDGHKQFLPRLGGAIHGTLPRRVADA